MKRYTLLYITAFVLGLCSCSNIAENDRYIYVQPEIGDKAVLVEDFTGQKCVNCPKATDVIHEMQEAYGEDKVIAVAIHSGPFGVTTPNRKYSIALKTDFTQQYWDAWFDDTQGQPVAKIDRGEASSDYANWSATVSDKLKEEATVDIDLDGSYNETSREFTLNSVLTSATAAGAKYQLWVVEDSIVTGQSQPDGEVDDQYVHNHVLREAINGVWGEDINLYQGELKLTHKYTIPEEYDAENVSVVAFVYTEAGVLQVRKVRLKVKG